MLQEKDHRIHKSEEGVPTIQLGCGGVIIADNYAIDGSHAGISFTLGKGDIGKPHRHTHGKSDGDIGAFLRIIATKPESLQILINKLELAKANFGAASPPE